MILPQMQAESPLVLCMSRTIDHSGLHVRFCGAGAQIRASGRWWPVSRSPAAAMRFARADDLSLPVRLTVPDLLIWPEHEADVSFECATSGFQHHRFTGPLLQRDSRGRRLHLPGTRSPATPVDPWPRPRAVGPVADGDADGCGRRRGGWRIHMRRTVVGRPDEGAHRPVQRLRRGRCAHSSTSPGRWPPFRPPAPAPPRPPASAVTPAGAGRPGSPPGRRRHRASPR